MPPKEKEKDKNTKQSLAPRRNSPALITATSCSVVLSKTKRNTDEDNKIRIWPEWSENEMNSEKWDVLSSKGGKSGKASATPGNLFADPDGLVDLPGVLAGNVDAWKRPSEIIVDKQPVVVVEGEEVKEMDLYTPNAHLMDNKVLRAIICQVSALWESRQSVHIATPDFDQLSPTWTPWDHIHPRPKGGTAPVYNPGGKYCVRLHWMGCWRKIVVDDQIPISSSGKVLLPSTSSAQELWPMIVSKAILKVWSTDCGLEETSVITLLTGWLPRTVKVDPGIALGRSSLWKMLYDSLPLWQRGSPPLSPANSSPVQSDQPPSEPVKEQPGGKGGQQATSGSSEHSLVSNTNGESTRNLILLADYNSPPSLLPSQAQQSVEAENTTVVGVDLPLDRPHHVLLTMIRDQELVIPEKKPPEPVLQEPYYLGLLERKRRECDPPVIPTPPPRESRYLQIHSLLQGRNVPLLEDERRPIKESNHLESVVEEPEDGGEPEHRSSADSCEENLEEKTEAIEGEETVEEASEEGDSGKDPSEQTSWVQWEDFANTFNSVVAFYRPEGFQCREALEDMSETVTSSAIPPVQAKGKATALVTSQTTLQSPSQILLKQAERNFLFVDCIVPVQLLLSFSSLSHWRSTDKNRRERKQSSSSNRGSASNVAETVEPEEPSQAPHSQLCGSLCVEKYSWRTLSQGHPVCVLKTKATATSLLNLPAGCHCFRLIASSPHAYRVDVMSNQMFVLTDELTVFEHMRENSKRFIAHGEKVTTTVVQVLQHFPDLDIIEKELSRLGRIHKAKDVHKRHTQIVYSSISHSLWELQRTHKIPFSVVSAVRTLLQHSMLVFRAHVTGELTEGDDISQRAHELRNVTVPETWYKRIPSEEESSAVVRIQRSWRRFLVKRHTRSFVKGFKEMEELEQNLSTAVEVLSPVTSHWGGAIFTTLFKLEPPLLEKFPFFTDEWSRAFFQDYEGSYKEITPNSWGVVCREVFHFEESQFVQFQMKLPFTTCCLRVFDNDNGEELPSVLRWTAPRVYTPNKHGYTVVVDGWAGSEPLPSGPYILRIISSSPTLPLRAHQGKASQTGSGIEKIGTSLVTKAMKEYYRPDRDLIVFRYSLKNQKNALISAQMSTSKNSALIRMEILDHGSPVMSAEGRGSCVIPAYLLRASESETLQENSSLQHEDTRSKHEHHKYALRARVLRDSWTVAESAWNQLGEDGLEREDSRPSTSSSEKPPSGKGGKGGKSSRAGGKGKASQQQQVQFDPSKPHWILYVVTSADSSVEVEKETEREDELKSMTQAWEAEQPGRLKKGMESRRKFLESRAVPKETISKVLNDGNVQLPPRNPLDITHIDTSQYRIKSESPKVLTSEEMDERTALTQHAIKDYRSRRQDILAGREAERNYRNELKSKQLEWAEELIIQMSSECDSLNADRNAIRERALEIKRKAEAEAAAALQLQQQESSGRESKAKGKAGKGKKK